MYCNYIYIYIIFLNKTVIKIFIYKFVYKFCLYEKYVRQNDKIQLTRYCYLIMEKFFIY